MTRQKRRLRSKRLLGALLACALGALIGGCGGTDSAGSGASASTTATTSTALAGTHSTTAQGAPAPAPAATPSTTEKPPAQPTRTTPTHTAPTKSGTTTTGTTTTGTTTTGTSQSSGAGSPSATTKAPIAPPKQSTALLRSFKRTCARLLHKPSKPVQEAGGFGQKSSKLEAKQRARLRALCKRLR